MQGALNQANDPNERIGDTEDIQGLIKLELQK
jgi:hypothetical protein